MRLLRLRQATARPLQWVCGNARRSSVPTTALPFSAAGFSSAPYDNKKGTTKDWLSSTREKTSNDQSFLVREMDLFNQEMALVFGKSPQEMDSSDGTPSSQMAPTPSPSLSSTAPKDPYSGRTSDQTTMASDERTGGQPGATAQPKELFRTHKSKPIMRRQESKTVIERVELLEGPCLYSRDRLIGCSTQLFQEEVHRHAIAQAEQLGMSLQCKHSNHVGQIVEWVLDSDANALILHWNDDVARYPSLCRALEIAELPFVVLTPMPAFGTREFGSALTGVINGFPPQTRIAMALQALCEHNSLNDEQ